MTSCHPDETGRKKHSIKFHSIDEPSLQLKVLQYQHAIEKNKTDYVDPFHLMHGGESHTYQKDCLDASS